MIVDRIDRRDVYNNFVPDWKEAFDFALSLKDADPGRYECESLPAGTAFALVQEGHTRPYEEGKLEAHCRYMDVQIFLKGGEVVYYADIYGQGGQPATVTEGMFYAVMPHDAHMPSIDIDGTGTFRKIVLKIKVA